MTKFEEVVKQAIFAVLDQGRQSYHEDMGCLYRGEGGLKCVVGHIIKDEFYDSKIEEHSTESYQVTRAICKSIGFELSEEESRVLSRLQMCHDEAEVGYFRDLFRQEVEEAVYNGNLPYYCQEFITEWQTEQLYKNVRFP